MTTIKVWEGEFINELMRYFEHHPKLGNKYQQETYEKIFLLLRKLDEWPKMANKVAITKGIIAGRLSIQLELSEEAKASLKK